MSYLMRAHYAPNFDCVAFAGDEVTLRANVTDADGEAVDLDGREFEQRVFDPADPDEPLVAVTATTGLDEDGTPYLECVLPSSETAALLPAGMVARELAHVVVELLDDGSERTFIEPTRAPRFSLRRRAAAEA